MILSRPLPDPLTAEPSGSRFSTLCGQRELIELRDGVGAFAAKLPSPSRRRYRRSRYRYQGRRSAVAAREDRRSHRRLPRRRNVNGRVAGQVVARRPTRSGSRYLLSASEARARASRLAPCPEVGKVTARAAARVGEAGRVDARRRRSEGIVARATPSRVSLPLPPFRVSFPARPTSTSLPSLPFRISAFVAPSEGFVSRPMPSRFREPIMPSKLKVVNPPV